MIFPECGGKFAPAFLFQGREVVSEIWLYSRRAINKESIINLTHILFLICIFML